jgi:predicted protein tyrosine phosphatase
MDITVLSRAEAEGKEFHSGDWVISINERIDDPAKLVGPQRVLRLYFDDVEAPNPWAMTEADAISIWQFATQARESGKCLWVHCRAGISRSAGVADALSAAGLANWANKDKRAYIAGRGMGSAFFPNAHVSALIKRLAWAEETTQ